MRSTGDSQAENGWRRDDGRRGGLEQIELRREDDPGQDHGAREPHPQLDAVWQVVRDGLWYSIEDIALLAGCAPTSASARLRDLRKPKYGGWDVERAYAGGKQWRYRVREKAAAARPAVEVE